MQLGASMGRSVAATFRGAQGELNQLGSSMRGLKDKQRAIEKFEINTASVEKSRLAYQKARQELSQLKRAFREAEEPTKQLGVNIGRAQRKVEELSARIEKNRAALRQSRQSMDALGVSTHNLLSNHHRLGVNVDRLTAKYRSLSAVMAQQQKRAAQRSDLRGQIFDTVAVGAAVAAPIRVAVGFEESIAKLEAITKSDDPALGQEARRLGEETMFSASQAAQAMQFLGMAGFNTGKILEATGGVLDLAAASGSDLGQTADIASNILSAFSLKADQMGRVGNVLTETFTSSNTTLESLGETMKVAAPIAGSLGISIEEVAAMAGLLGDVGIQGSIAGTALRAAFLRLSAPPREAADALKRLRVETKDAEGNLRPMPELLKELAVAMSSMGTGQKAEAISRIFGTEASAAMTELMKQSRESLDETGKPIVKLEKRIEALNNATDATAKIAEKMKNTTAGQLRQLGSAVESVAISFGMALLPTLSATASFLTKFARGVSAFSQRFPVLTQVVGLAVVGLTTLKIAVLGSVFTFSVLASGVTTLVAGYTLFSAKLTLASLAIAKWGVMAKLTTAWTGVATAAQWAWNAALTANPIGLVVVAVGALIGAGALLIKHWDKVKTFFSDLWKNLKSMAASTIQWLVDNIHIFLNPIGAAIKGIQMLRQKFIKTRDPRQNVGTDLTASDTSLAEVGRTVTELERQPSAMAEVLPQVPNRQVVQQSQQVKIDAPITIQTTPGMNEQEIANLVQEKLEDQQVRTSELRHAALFDLS